MSTSTHTHKPPIPNPGDTKVFFDKERADSHDDMGQKLAPLVEAKLFAIQFALNPHFSQNNIDRRLLVV